MKGLKKEKAKKIFYIGTAVSVIIFMIGLVIGNSFPLKIQNMLVLNETFDLVFLMIYIPFCIWAWLILFALAFVPKDWKVRLLCFLLFVPHGILIAVDYSFSYGLFEILKQYLLILSFGIPLLF